MAGKWTDQGENNVGAVYFMTTGTAASFWVGIYDNATEPGETAVISDITEAHTLGAGGYARQEIARAAWSTSGAVVTGTQETFTASAASWGSCTGYFICTTSAGVTSPATLLLAVEQFSDGPYTINDGDSIKVTPVITVS